MDFKPLDALTATATGITALLMFLQLRLQNSAAAPHINAYNDENKDGMLLIRLVIHPGQHSLHFHKVSVRNADLIEAVFKTSSDGRYEPTQPAESVRAFAAVSIDLAPARVSPEPSTAHFFVKPRNSQSSVLISLHTRIMFLPVRYTATAVIRMKS